MIQNYFKVISFSSYIFITFIIVTFYSGTFLLSSNYMLGIMPNA